MKRSFHVAGLEDEFRELQLNCRRTPLRVCSAPVRKCRRSLTSVRKVATTDAPVLILGESGTGKEMVARAIHQRSREKDGPFVAINCSAIPETLLESELFGHEKGSFTGAHVQRKGRIETASGGTLFLDEIGEIPLPLQVKLLRFPAGTDASSAWAAARKSTIDTRVIAATNVDLKKAMRGRDISRRFVLPPGRGADDAAAAARPRG